MTSRTRTWGLRAFFVLGGLVAFCLVAGAIAHEPRPEHVAGAEDDADALARRMMEAVRTDRWEDTGAVRFRFVTNDHLWDRQRGFAQVSWGDTRVVLRTSDQRGFVFIDGQQVPASQAGDALAAAWARFCNDTFWLNPVAKMFDEGTSRHLVRVPEGEGVLVRYASGGVTPGDAYLWVPGPDGRPIRWQMWVSVVPIGGVNVSWRGWQELATGAWVATDHARGPLRLQLEEVRGEATLEALLDGAPDPFEPLLSL